MAKESEKGTVVRRIKASSADSSAARTDEKVAKKKVSTKGKIKKTVADDGKKPFFLLRPIFAIGRYFRNSWRELRQVRWTTRRATWALTLAVILFCLFFAALIMLFDWLFNWTMQEVIL